MRVCSFVPAATSMLYQMGLEKFLCGVTFECSSDKPRVVRSYLENNTYGSEEIEKIVSESRQRGRSLYYVDEELLQSIAPDIIFTQDVCDVCQIGASYAERAIHKLKKKPQAVSLNPRNLDDVFDNAITIAKTLGREEAAYMHLAELKKRTDRITDKLRKHNAPLKRAMVMEWLSPIYNCGHWIPYQIALAGAVDMLSNPSGYSVITPWEKVLQYNPEVLVVAPCGFNIERTATELDKLSGMEGWNNLLAVRNNAVFIADAGLFTCPSTTLVDGIELLSALFHPSLFGIPDKLRRKVAPLAVAQTLKG